MLDSEGFYPDVLNESHESADKTLRSRTKVSSQEAIDLYMREKLDYNINYLPLSEPERFLQLVIGAYACICVSTSYVYNLFSGKLQEKYNFTQDEMATITTVASVVGGFTLPYGMLFDYYGPKYLFLTGLIFFPVGAFLFGLSFADYIDGNVFRFTIYNCLLSISTSVLDTAALMSVMSTFPRSKGAVVAVMKTFIGLGSSIFGAIQLGFFEENMSGFFYFLGCTVLVFGLLGYYIIKLPPYHLTGSELRNLSLHEQRARLATRRAYFEQIPSIRRFFLGFVFVTILLVFLPIESALTTYYYVDRTHKQVFAIIVMVIVAIYSVIAIPIGWLDRGKLLPFAVEEEDEQDPSLGPIYRGEPDRLSFDLRQSARSLSRRRRLTQEAVFQSPPQDDSCGVFPQYTTTFIQSLQEGTLWAFGWSIFCIAGTEMTIIANARFIYAAAAEEPISNTLGNALTVFAGVCSAAGRIFVSFFEVWTQRAGPSKRTPLTIVIFFPTVAVLIACFALIIAPKNLLLLPFILAAFGNGCTAATIVLVMRTLYAKDVAKHYSFTSISSLLSSVLLNKFLYGGWYSRVAAEKGSTQCFGKECIFLPFLIMSLLVLTSLITNAYIHLTYCNFCSSCDSTNTETRPDFKKESVTVDSRGSSDRNYSETTPLILRTQP